MSKKPQPRQVVHVEKPRCPYCAHDKYNKLAGAWRTLEHPNGATSRFFRVKCRDCLQNFVLREITQSKAK